MNEPHSVDFADILDCTYPNCIWGNNSSLPVTTYQTHFPTFWKCSYIMQVYIQIKLFPPGFHQSWQHTVAALICQSMFSSADSAVAHTTRVLSPNVPCCSNLPCALLHVVKHVEILRDWFNQMKIMRPNVYLNNTTVLQLGNLSLSYVLDSCRVKALSCWFTPSFPHSRTTVMPYT